MAGYIRQSTFVDGDTIAASLFNNEYNQLVNSFSNTSGHKHDGTTAEGPVIGLIGDAGETSPNNKVLIDTTNNYIEFYVQVSDSPVQQMYIADGAIIPVTDSDIDLGTTSLRFKDTYTDTITTTGNVDVGGNLTVTGTTTFNGGTITMGDAATDNVVFGADVDSNIIPDDDDSYDLGSSSQEWRNLYIDGTAHIDTLDVDVNATIAGTLGVTGVLTGTSLDISGDIDVDGTTNLDVVDIDGAVDMATTLAVAGNVDFNGDLDVDGTTNLDVVDIDGAVNMATTLLVTGNVDFNGDLDVDGTTNLDVVDIDGAVDMATTLAVAGNVDFNGDLDVDGTTNLDVVDIDGAVDMATTLTVGGEITAASLDISGNVDIDGTLETDALSINSTVVTSTAAELNILDGVTSTAAELNILDGVTSTATELNLLDGVTSTTAELNILDGVTASATDINLIDGITNGTVIASKAIITDANKDITGGRNITISGELDAATLDISGDADIDGTLEADAITIGGITLAETISDTVGAMVSSNTETNITVSYDDADNTLDFVIGTLNQDTTGNAATATALETARTIGGTSFDGTTNIAVGLADTATALATARTIHGVSFDGTANIDLSEVIQDTVGAMVSSNTESAITVTYQDDDGTLDFSVAATDSTQIVDADNDTKIQVEESSDEDKIRFDTGGTERMIIDSTGVGIGTSSPAYPLDISGDRARIAGGTTTTFAGLEVENSNGFGTIFGTGGSERSDLLDNRGFVSAQSAASGLALGTEGADPVIFYTGGTTQERMRIDGSSGNTSIGTTSTSRKLTVTGSSTSEGTIYAYTNAVHTGTDTNAHVSIRSDNASASGDVLHVRGDGSGNLLTIDKSGTEVLVVNSSGKVGIGTSSPTEKLTINGALAMTGALADDRTSTAAMDFSGGVTRFISYGASGTGGEFAFRTASGGSSSVERLRIDDEGHIGINMTPSPVGNDKVLSIYESNTPRIKLHNASTGTAGTDGGEINMSGTDFILENREAGNLRLFNNGAERMRIDSAGKVLINNTDATPKGIVNIRGAVSNAVTTVLSFDDMGARGAGTAQAIDFIMGRSGWISEDACASIRGVCEAGSSTSASHGINLEFYTGAGSGQTRTMKLKAFGSITQFNTDEVPTYGNPYVGNSIVIGPTTATGLVNGGLTTACALYNKSGELYATDSSNNNTQLTPHNWELIDDGPSEELAWTYWSQRPSPDDRDITQAINVDIAKVVRKVEDLVGEKLIYTQNSNMDDHVHQNVIADIQTALANLTTRIEALES